ncbi:MAG: hypothetical protein ACQETB_02390 [Halobacteriota archaeon]
MSDADHTDDEHGSTLSRRTAIAAGGSILSVAALGSFAFTQPALAVSASTLDASDDEITSHDGSIDGITVDPVLAIEWEGFNSESSTADIEITFTTADENEDLLPYAETVTLSGTHGSDQFDYPQTDLLAEGWSASTFEPTGDGQTKETDVTVEFSVVTPTASAAVTDTFTVIVHNYPASIGVGGQVNTTAESDTEV